MEGSLATECSLIPLKGLEQRSGGSHFFFATIFLIRCRQKLKMPVLVYPPKFQTTR
jgi:hypothetical protein